MVTLVNEVGNKYGRLMVLGRSVKDNPGRAKWVCECNCGSFTIAPGYALRDGSRVSCGCSKSGPVANRLPSGEAMFNKLFYSYIKSAKKRGYSFELSKEHFRELTKQSCCYCGTEPQQIKSRGDKRYNGDYIYSGIDRVDNEKGYSLDNVVPCCKRCNHAKKDLAVGEFIDMCRAVSKNTVEIYGNY